MSDSVWLRRGVGESTLVVGGVVREYRLAAGLSQVAVAELLGVSQQFLSQLEKGSRNATLEQRLALVKVLGVPPEDLGLAARQPAASGSVSGDAAVAASRGRWRVQRHWLNSHRADLGRVAAEFYGTRFRVAGTSLIAAPGWVPDGPVDLDSIVLRLSEGRSAVAVDGSEEASEGVRPLRTGGARFESYSAAVKHLDRPRLFESRPSYRLLAADLGAGALDFGLAEYFDKLDVCEAVAHELAAECMVRGFELSEVRDRLPFRSLVGDPFDAGRRALIPAVTTLTIRLRRHPDPPSFLLHWRDPARVATAAGMYDVIPAGEFQPSSIALWDRENDFSLWRNIVREYSEELLGQPEHDGSRAIDYEAWPLYRVLGEARRRGKVTAHVLGLGLDALSLAATILTVVVIDDDVFDEIFGATVRFNEEGEVVAIGDGRAADGVPFTAEVVGRLLDTEPVAAPGAACLALAWKHRHTLIG